MLLAVTRRILRLRLQQGLLVDRQAVRRRLLGLPDRIFADPDLVILVITLTVVGMRVLKHTSSGIPGGTAD